MTAARRPPDLAEATALVRIGAAVAEGDPARLKAALDPAMRSGVTADDVEEILLQTHLFAGYPRAIEAFRAWAEWLAERDLERGRIVIEPEDVAEWRGRGEALCRRIYAGSFATLQARLARLHPALADWTLVEGYGKVLGRPGPDAARRELAAVGALIGLAAERQLASHLKGALHVGVPPDTLAAAVRAVAAERNGSDAAERGLAGLERKPAE